MKLFMAAALVGQYVQAEDSCRGQTRFDTIMCQSHMCTDCALEFCMEECQKFQLLFPTCRCEDWPASRKSFSGGDFAGKGKFGCRRLFQVRRWSRKMHRQGGR